MERHLQPKSETIKLPSRSWGGHPRGEPGRPHGLLISGVDTGGGGSLRPHGAAHPKPTQDDTACQLSPKSKETPASKSHSKELLSAAPTRTNAVRIPARRGGTPGGGDAADAGVLLPVAPRAPRTAGTNRRGWKTRGTEAQVGARGEGRGRETWFRLSGGELPDLRGASVFATEPPPGCRHHPAEPLLLCHVVAAATLGWEARRVRSRRRGRHRSGQAASGGRESCQLPAGTSALIKDGRLGSRHAGDAGTTALPAPPPPHRKKGTVAGVVQSAFSFRLFLCSAPSAEVGRQTQTLAAPGRR